MSEREEGESRAVSREQREPDIDAIKARTVDGMMTRRDIHALIDALTETRAQLAAAERERDARDRELHDESTMLHTALLGRSCAEEGAVGACHPMVCDCGTPYEDFSFRDMCEAVAQLRAQLAAAERERDRAVTDVQVAIGRRTLAEVDAEQLRTRAERAEAHLALAESALNGGLSENELLRTRVAELERDGERLREAISLLGGALSCDDFHHSKKDSHTFSEPCPVSARFYRLTTRNGQGA